jgi:hypothetical protein
MAKVVDACIVGACEAGRSRDTRVPRAPSRVQQCEPLRRASVGRRAWLDRSAGALKSAANMTAWPRVLSPFTARPLDGELGQAAPRLEIVWVGVKANRPRPGATPRVCVGTNW